MEKLKDMKVLNGWMIFSFETQSHSLKLPDDPNIRSVIDGLEFLVKDIKKGYRKSMRNSRR